MTFGICDLAKTCFYYYMIMLGAVGPGIASMSTMGILCPTQTHNIAVNIYFGASTRYRTHLFTLFGQLFISIARGMVFMWCWYCLRAAICRPTETIKQQLRKFFFRMFKWPLAIHALRLSNICCYCAGLFLLIFFSHKIFPILSEAR